MLSMWTSKTRNKLLASGFQLGIVWRGHCSRHSILRSAEFSQEESEMDFQVNDQTYFLSLAEDETRWRVLVSSPTGAWRIPVYEDAAELAPLVVLQEEKHRIPN
jgi:hypothetical protein